MKRYDIYYRENENQEKISDFESVFCKSNNTAVKHAEKVLKNTSFENAICYQKETPYSIIFNITIKEEL